MAVTTEITLKLHPRLVESATILAPFATLAEVAQAVPHIVSSGVDPSILEYIDVLAMGGITASAGLDLAIPEEIKASTLAYLVVVLDGVHAARVEEDVDALATLLSTLGALDVFVLPSGAGSALIAARERAFFVSKAAGADDIVDAVLPRAGIPDYLARVADLAGQHGALITGCGHVGDGNVHLSVFQPDEDRRHALLDKIYETAIAAGGAVSGEHGIGTEKLSYFLDTVDAVNLDLMRSIKRGLRPPGDPRAGTASRPQRGNGVNGARALLSTLVGAGVDVCFANPGTSEMHFVAALDDVPQMRGDPDALRGRGHRSRRRLRPGSRAARRRRCCTWARAGQRAGQPAQRPAGPVAAGQHCRATTPPTTPASMHRSSPTSPPLARPSRGGTG